MQCTKSPFCQNGNTDIEMFKTKGKIFSESILTYNVETQTSLLPMTSPVKEFYKEDIHLSDGIDSDCLGVGDWKEPFSLNSTFTSMPKVNDISVPMTDIENLDTDFTGKRKIFSLKQPDKLSMGLLQTKFSPFFKFQAKDKECDIGSSSNNFCAHYSSEQNSGLESMTGEKGELLTF